MKLRHVAAAVVDMDPRSDTRSLDEPELFVEAVELTPRHARRTVHRARHRVGEGFRRPFSYVDDAGSAADRSSARCEVVRIDDMAPSPIYTRADVALLADEGIRAQLAVLMCDDTGLNWGAVDVLFAERHPRIDPFGVDMLHGHADACAQWLRWYDLAVMPKLVPAVHRAVQATGLVDVARHSGEAAATRAVAVMGPIFDPDASAEDVQPHAAVGDSARAKRLNESASSRGPAIRGC